MENFDLPPGVKSMKFTFGVDHDAVAINFHMTVPRFSGMKLVNHVQFPLIPAHFTYMTFETGQ